MMATVASGPPGIEVPWEWNGAITLNDLSDLSAEVLYRIRKVTGLHSLAEADDNRTPNTGMRGEHLLPSYARGKTIVAEGEIQARVLDHLAVARQAMLGAFRERNREGTMELQGDPVWFFNARVLQLDIEDEQRRPGTATRPHSREFTLGLRIADGRSYTPLVALSDGDAAGATETVTNDGSTDTPPVFSIDPTAAEVTITNLSLEAPDGNDARLRFNGVDVGRNFTVDFRRRTARYDDDGEDVLTKLNVAFSNWWDELMPGLEPGASDLKVDGGTWTVAWRHASE